MKNSEPRKCRRFYGHGIPHVRPEQMAGKLIVVEGADGSGRSTQILDLVNWLETCGNPKGVIMARWQRVTRELGEQDAPTMKVVPLSEVKDHLPHDQSITPQQWRAKIEARQVGIAKRMLS